MVWADFGMGNVKFSRTTDGGGTWSPPVVVDQPGPAALDQPGPAALDVAPRLLVLPDGTSLTVFVRANFELGDGVGELHAARSLDDGRTWLPAVQFASKPIQTFFDPEGEALPQPQFPSAAVAPDGTVYVAIEANDSATSGVISVATSRDGGLTWRSAPLPGVSAYAFEPAIAVDKHGTVGVTWYDLRNDRPRDAALTADVWFAHSDNRGSSWRQTHVAGPTDLRTAPLPAHNYVGEYQGLAALAAAASPRSSHWLRRRPRTGRRTSSSPGSGRADAGRCRCGASAGFCGVRRDQPAVTKLFAVE